MSSLAVRQLTVHAERRGAGRFLVEIPVKFRTVSGIRDCWMGNISDTGAMIQTDSPPAEGVSGWLIMGDVELYCSVAWSSDRNCGIKFEHALGQATLAHIASKDKRQDNGPSARRGNIAVGRKRSSLVSSRN